ncbi:MAG: KH domain-containing protein [Candidatus Thermoplasmatota archaeon]|nr:KH domain-containing protein [Candidatus Thermoplasmatota archaeon]
MVELLYARISSKRLGVLIGTEGRTKKKLEEQSGVKIFVDSSSGEVTIDEASCEDPTMGLKAKDVVQAIGRGFSDEKAMELLEEDAFLRIFDIKDFTHSRSRVMELKGRVIGSHGKTRRLIEELTGTSLSIYGHTVSIIGSTVQLNVSCRAVEMLLTGSEHASVYQYMERMRPRLSVEKMGF